MGLILNIDTATSNCSIALGLKGKEIAFSEAKEVMSHASKLTVLIQDLIKENKLKLSDLDAVAVSSGPGSYTGLRIGTSVAKGLCYALNIPLIAVSTLEALAYASHQLAPNEDHFCIPLLDARRMEVYTAVFDGTTKIEKDHAKIIDELSFKKYIDSNKKIIFSGNAQEKCKPVLTHPSFHYTSVVSSASHLIALSWKHFQNQKMEEMAYFTPFYLKPPNITTKKKNI